MEEVAVATPEANSLRDMARLVLTMERSGCHCLLKSGQPLPMPGRAIAIPAPALALIPEDFSVSQRIPATTVNSLRLETGYDPPGIHCSISSTILRI